MESNPSCPICGRSFSVSQIENHVDKCLFLSSNQKSPSTPPTLPPPKKLKTTHSPKNEQGSSTKVTNEKNIPLAEKLRPKIFDEYIGQSHILGEDKILKRLISMKSIPSMILWGPPGCGKTSLANLISHMCSDDNSLRFIKISATMSGVNDVKEIVKVAKNEMKFKRKTILFMDEIRRFNKLQQDTFLPHIENGTIILIGATTENPSFSLNSALLSRCRVVILEKLTVENIMTILIKALVKEYNGYLIDNSDEELNLDDLKNYSIIIERQTLEWLANISDGDARIALNSFQMASQMKDVKNKHSPNIISLEDIKDGIKRSHLLYDRKGEEHYNIISALHKSVRASDDNATLYWLTRMVQGGEDPLYIARRLVRIAGEDIGLADPNALTLAVSCMQGCQFIGMPECDVLLAECAVYLARAPKSTEVYKALGKCKSFISEHKGALPSVPLHLRNAPTKLMTQIGYGKGYNTKHKDKSNLIYMPEGSEDVKFFI